jgi:chorismate dehydratase
MNPIRIGAVSYLNSKPLIEDLAELAPSAELILDYPSRLADRLGQGELDIALIPSIECVLGPQYEIVSDACVATHGPVLSVKLYSRVPMSEIRTLALDEGSRTSAALAKILLAERYSLHPQVERLSLDLDTRDTVADAILLIGDRAIHPPAEIFPMVWDLGTEWTNWTGLPFVFAMWATRAGTDLGPVEEALSQARDLGLRRVAEIAGREAPLLGLSEQVTLEYLTENLYYRLGPAERRGFQRYHELAMKQGLAPKGYDLVFRHCALA